MVEFQGKFNGNATKKLNARIFKKLWWLFALISVLLIAIGTVGIVLREDSEDLAFGIYIIAFGVLFTPFVLLLSKVMQKCLNKSMSIMSNDTTEIYQFYPDRLIVTQTQKKAGEEDCEYQAITNTRYTYLFRVEETRDTYFMSISKTQTHVVNKCDLTQGSIEELNEILVSKLGKKFKKFKP